MAKNTSTRSTKKPTKSVKSRPTKSASSKSKSVSAKSKKLVRQPKKTHLLVTLSVLRKWNIWIGLLTLAQAIILLLVGHGSSISVGSGFLNADALATNAEGKFVLSPAVKHLADVNILILVVLVLGAAAIASLLLATRLRDMYETQLKAGVNKLRWAEFGFSSVVIFVVLAMINGLQEKGSLFMLAALVAAIHWFGYLLETKRGNEEESRRLFGTMMAAGAVVWLVIGCLVFGAISYGEGLSKGIYLLDASILTATVLLASVTYRTMHKDGKWADYLYGERAYLALSFLAKSVFVWQVWAMLLK